MCNKDQVVYKSFSRKYITRAIQTNLNLIKRNQLTPDTQTLHPLLHHELVYQERTNELGMAYFPQEEGRYSEHILYCNTFYNTQQYL